jgi:uncharacterized membrane protein YdbT with pleckstrin-like domain
MRGVPFPTKLLNQGEEIVLDLRPHWWRIVPASAILAAAVVFGIVALAVIDIQFVNVVAGILVLGALMYFVSKYISWISDNFVVTTERVISRSGVFAKSGIEIPLDRINTVFFNQTVFERMLGAGDLGVESAGEAGRQNFYAIRKPNLVQQEVYRAMEKLEHRDFQRMGQATADAIGAHAAAAAPSIPQQIEQLDELRRKGAISDAEFEAKKRDLLDRM